MSSVILPSRSASNAGSEANDASRLRAPGERSALVFCIVANFVVLGLAVAVILLGTGWLATHPFIAKHIDTIRTALIAAALALPAPVVGRHVAIPAVRGGGVRVGKEQFPELRASVPRARDQTLVEPRRHPPSSAARHHSVRALYEAGFLDGSCAMKRDGARERPRTT